MNAITVKVRPKTYTVKVKFPGPQGPGAANGGGSQSGDPFYIHPTSRKVYLYNSGLYYEHAVQILDGGPQLVWLGTSTATPT